MTPELQRLIAWHQAMADEPKRNQAKRAKHLETVAALSQAEAYRVDADLYRWIEAQKSLCIESVAPSEWTRADRSKYIQTHRVCAGQTQFAAYPTLRETIEAARLTNAVKTKG